MAPAAAVGVGVPGVTVTAVLATVAVGAGDGVPVARTGGVAVAIPPGVVVARGGVAVGEPGKTVRLPVGLGLPTGRVAVTVGVVGVGVKVKEGMGAGVGTVIWVGVAGSVGVGVGVSPGWGVTVGVPLARMMGEGGESALSLEREMAVVIPTTHPAVAVAKSIATTKYQSRLDQPRERHHCHSCPTPGPPPLRTRPEGVVA